MDTVRKPCAVCSASGVARRNESAHPAYLVSCTKCGSNAIGIGVTEPLAWADWDYEQTEKYEMMLDEQNTKAGSF